MPRVAFRSSVDELKLADIVARQGVAMDSGYHPTAARGAS